MLLSSNIVVIGQYTFKEKPIFSQIEVKTRMANIEISTGSRSGWITIVLVSSSTVAEISGCSVASPSPRCLETYCDSIIVSTYVKIKIWRWGSAWYIHSKCTFCIIRPPLLHEAKLTTNNNHFIKYSSTTTSRLLSHPEGIPTQPSRTRLRLPLSHSLIPTTPAPWPHPLWIIPH